jgi:ABC-type nickel/cobalt efflux system permease component RcnA
VVAYSLDRTLTEERSPWIAGAVLATYAALGFHVAAVALGFALVCIGLARRRSLHRGAVAISAAAVLFLSGLYLWADWRVGFPNTRAMLVSYPSKYRWFDPHALKVFQYLPLVTTCEVSHWAGRGAGKVLRFYGYPSPWFAVGLACIGASVSLSLYAFVRFFREEVAALRRTAFSAYVRERPGAFLVAVWLLSVVVFVLLVRQAAEARYMQVSAYAAFLILALGADALLRRVGERRRLRALASAALAGFFAYEQWLVYALVSR